MKLKKKFTPWKDNYDRPREHVKKQRHHFPDKGLYSQTYGFSSSHVDMWELHHKDGSVPKNWCLQTVVLKKILNSPLDGKEIKAVNPEENQSWIFMEELMLKLKLYYFGHLKWRVDSLEKTLILGKTESKRRGGGRGWDGWMASLAQWTWIWEISGR